MGIDSDAREEAFKVLIVIFIIITIIVNGAYLFKYFRSPRAIYLAGHFGKIALALGSIFLALFSYVVEARLVFEDADDMTCRTILTDYAYQTFFFPFVFGASFVTIWLDMTLSQSRCNAKLMSLAMAAIPWLVALVLICPIALDGINFSECRLDEDFDDRTWPLNLLGRFLPAVAAFVLSIVLYCHAKTGTNTEQPFPTSHPMTPGSAQTAHAAAPIASYNAHLATVNIPPTGPVAGQLPQQPGNPKAMQPPFQYHQPQQTPLQYPQQNIIVLQQYPPPYAQQPYPQIPQATGMPIDTQNDLTPQQKIKEKHNLCVASMIFLLSVLPLTIFNLSNDVTPYTAFPPEPSTTTIVIRDICWWISNLYPVLVPISWWSQVQI